MKIENIIVTDFATDILLQLSRFRKKIFVATLLRICNGIAIELQQHILQRLIVVANLLQSCNGIATEIEMVCSETVADLLQICNGIATTLTYSLSFDFWDLATELATNVKSVAI